MTEHNTKPGTSQREAATTTALARREQPDGDTRPALVLLDLGLPDLTGQAVAEGLRARYGAGVPLLVVTGAAHPLEGAAEARALVYVRKPFTIAELLVAVRALLSAAADSAESSTPAAAR